MTPIDYHEVYVVSDLHVGGPPEHRVFTDSERLAGAFRLAGASAGDRPAALVINGDFIDFLSTAEKEYLRPTEVVEQLEDVEKQIPAVFEAMREFIARPGRLLVLAIGNHDLELAMPEARRWLTEKLCAGKEDRQARLHFALDGTGWRCTVAGQSVLCVHGNEVDRMNWVDHEALRRVVYHLNRSRAPKAWKPNGGTRLVVDVLNDLRIDFPFIELLKPELELVLPLIIALRPKLAGTVGALSAIGYSYAGGVRKARPNLSVPADDEQAPEASAASDWRAASREQVADDELQLLLESGRTPREVMWDEGAPGSLGLTQYFIDRLRGKKENQALFEAFKDWLSGDQTFELAHADDAFKRLDRSVDPSVRFLVAGHTHLRRSLSRPGGGSYLNSGTWSLLIQVPPGALEDQSGFDEFYKKLRRRSLKELVTAKLARLQPTVARVYRQGDRAVGELVEVHGSPAQWSFQPVDGSRRPS